MDARPRREGRRTDKNQDLEVMAEMKQPSQFDKSLYCTTATMIAFYVGTSVVFYFSFGSGVPVSPRRGPAGPRAAGGSG